MKMLLSRSGLLILAFGLQVLSVSSRAEERKLIAKSAGDRVQLLELYSSEGCSSCPPAEDWASGLKSQPDLWKSFVPVAFHVDYWNDLGWRDEWSSAEATARQRSLASQWKNDAVYTPAFVLDGKEWRDWKRASPPKVATHKESSVIELAIYKTGPNSFAVQTHGLKAGHGYTIRFARLGMSLSSKVTAGENSGRTLKHDFVVLNLMSRSLKSGSSDEKFDFKDAAVKNAAQAVAAWIEDENNLTPIQAAGGPLS